MYTDGGGRGFNKNEYNAQSSSLTIMRVAARTAGYQQAGGGMMFVRRWYKSYTFC